MRRIVKRIAERALVLGGVSVRGRVVNRGRAQVLMYHNIIPSRSSSAGDRSLHLSRDEFARQLDYLHRACEVVPLETLLEDAPPSGDRTRVAITFDDAYVGAVSLGVEELTRRNLAGTIFVPPGLLGQQTWWDVLGNASPNGLNDDVRENLLMEPKGQLEAIRRSAEWPASGAGSSLGPEFCIADVRMLDQAAERPGITLGSHTWSHPNLAKLDDDALDVELGRSFVWLRERYASFRPYISYPYGLSSPRVEQAARRAGYIAGLSADGGWLPRNTSDNRFGLPRFDVASGLSLDGLRLRLAGFRVD